MLRQCATPLYRQFRATQDPAIDDAALGWRPAPGIVLTRVKWPGAHAQQVRPTWHIFPTASWLKARC